MADARPRVAWADERIIEAGWDPLPRWLRYSGLPQVLQPPSVMDVYEVLLLRTLDNRTRERPPALSDGQLLPAGAINFTRDELARLTGYGEKTAGRAIPALTRHNLLMIIKRGYKLRTGQSEPSWGTLDLQLLEWIYVLSCGSIPRDVGGLCEWGRGEERLSVRLWQAAEPIAILRCLGADDRWQEPPVQPLRLLLAAPKHFDALRQQVARTRTLQAEVGTLERAIERGIRVDVEGLESRLAELTWRPEELVQAVENIVERVGKRPC